MIYGEIIMKKSRLLGAVCACALPFSVTTANATTFDWTTSNPNVVRGGSSFSLTVDGITATAEAYVAEWNGSSYDIFGAFPTNTSFTTANADGFLRGGEGLMLEEGQSPVTGIIDLGGEEACAGGGCTFDNGSYKSPNNGILKFNFALISFDQSVDLETSMNLRTSNFDHDFWLASSSSAPDLGQDFITAFTGFTTTVHDPLASFQGATNLSGTHQNLQYLAIGAPLHALAGDFPGFNNPNSFGDAFSITSQTVQLATVPIPAAVWLFGSGLLGLVGVARCKKTA